MDQIACISEKAIHDIRQVSCHLLHPFIVGLMAEASDLHPARFEVDDEQHEVADQSAAGQHLNGEEIHRGYRSPMSFQERTPWRALTSLRCRLDTVFREDALHRVSADFVAQVAQSPANPRIAPAGIFPRYPDNELTNRFRRARTTRAAVLAPIVLLRDELFVPAQQGVGCHEAGDFFQALPSQCFRLRGQTPTLVVRKTNATAAQFLSKNSILLLQVFDGVLLFPAEPAGDRHEEKLHEIGLHGRILAAQEATAAFVGRRAPSCNSLSTFTFPATGVLAHYGIEFAIKPYYWYYGNMKTTLELPDDLMRDIKIRAVKENRKLKDAIADLLKRGLSQKTVEPTTVRNRVKLPLVQCVHEARPGEEMTPERVARVLLEEESETRRGTLR
jgi:hypothetical protein